MLPSCFVLRFVCMNKKTDSVTVSATFGPNGNTQSFSPNACDPAWVLFQDSCYFFHSDKAIWSEANRVCSSSKATLASVHSDLENDFLYSLTGGISTWIGFTDVKKDAANVDDYRWTDNTQVDYRNWSEPGSSHPEKEWHEWDNRDPAPFICKKASNSPTRVLFSRNDESSKPGSNQIMHVDDEGGSEPESAGVDSILLAMPKVLDTAILFENSFYFQPISYIRYTPLLQTDYYDIC